MTIAQQLTQEAASRLVEEPPEGTEGAVMFAVRLPDGRRVTRRLLRHHPLQVLFDFLDADSGISAGEYQLVASFPRRVFAREVRESCLQVNSCIRSQVMRATCSIQRLSALSKVIPSLHVNLVSCPPLNLAFCKVFLAIFVP